MKFGFIGLGRMGGALARNLIRAGYDVTVYDISSEAVEKTLAVGGAAAESPREVSEQADVLFTSLPLPKHLTDLFIDGEGILNVMKPDSTIIDVSTIDPGTARRICHAAEDKGIRFLACPLGKGPAQAEAGTQPIYAGGKEEVFHQFEEVLKQISTDVRYLGDVEQATAFKLVSNMIGMTNVLVLCEGIRIGEKAGIDPKLLQELLATTAADSYQLTLRGPKLLNQDYAPGFTVNLTLKDVRLGVDMASTMDQQSPFSALAVEYFQKAQNNGYGDDDCAAVYKLFS